jgi:hypothetical protein
MMYEGQQRMYCHLNAIPLELRRDATVRALRYTFVLTVVMVVAVDQSVKQATTNLTYVIKSTNSLAQNVSSHVINYQCFYRFVIIREVALQEYKEYNNLPYRIQ